MAKKGNKELDHGQSVKVYNQMSDGQKTTKDSKGKPNHRGYEDG